ncbi:dihydropyrimidinase [Spirochaetia bacterium]|nr:dihydropyrimidinase [Spirochaetia bacterium]
MKGLLIKNALVVSETGEAVQDVLSEGERIKLIGKELRPADSECEVIDAEGKILIPGGVDVHTHMNLDVGSAVASDDFYTGTVAAAWGGTTTIVDHPGFGPANCAIDHQIKKYHGLAEGKAVIDYSFHGVIQHVDDSILDGMSALIDQGISSFKIYLTYGFKIPDGDVYRVLERAKALGAMITVHPENDGVIQQLRDRFVKEGRLSPHYHPLSRPAECEAEAVNRMILFAHMAGDAPLYIVHLSNALGLSFIKSARDRGQKNLYAETCPQYLFLDDSLYDGPGNEGLKYIMCPPLRKKADQEMLWKGLAADINTVATDHCPFFFETQKILGKDDFTKCPSGAPGVEERIPLLFSEGVMKKRITLRRFTDLCSANPAKLFGMYPQKGVIKEGSDADMVIIHPKKKRVLQKSNLHANVDYSAYEGMEVTGLPEYVISRGEVILRDRQFSATAGRGKFIKRNTAPSCRSFLPQP